MKERFELAFADTLAENKNGNLRNLLITDNNLEFLDEALCALRGWTIKNGINLVELDERDSSWLPEIYSRELFDKLNQPNTVLLIKNYATVTYMRGYDDTPRNFLRDVVMNRYYSRGNLIVPFQNLMYVVVLNDLSEMKWRSKEYVTFSVIHQDDTQKVWTDTKFSLESSNMHPVMSAVNKVVFWVSEDETTLCVDVGEAFKGGVALRHPKLSKRPTMEDKTEIIHTYIESKLPFFHDKVACLILKTTKDAEDELFIIDGRRLKKIFPNLGSICCKDNFKIEDTEDDICVLDPFEVGEMCFNLAQDGDVDMANTLVRDLWALDCRWAKFFRQVARDYYRRAQDHVKVDPDNTMHAPTGMDHLFHIYWLGWYHTGDDFFDEEDKVYSIFHENFNKAVDLLPARFQNCSVDEVSEKLYWDIQYAENDDRPGYFNFEKILREAERLCPGVQDKMCENGWLTKDEGAYFITKYCNMCGKSFTFWDNQENFCLDHRVGFGSSYDLHRIRLNLCCNCFDKVMDWIRPQCMHNPVSEYQ